MNFPFFTTKSADVSAYDYGYMSTNGKDGLAATETTDKENPYYFKLEQPNPAAVEFKFKYDSITVERRT